MRKPTRIAGYAAAGLAGLGALVLLLDFNRYKPRIEAAASEAAGMEVRIGGDIGLGFYPGLRVRVEDLRVRNRGSDLLAVERLRVGVDWLALLRGRVEVASLHLGRPVVLIERGRDGRYNFEKDAPRGDPLPPLQLGRLSVADATLRHVDRQTGRTFEAVNCDVDARDIAFAGGPSAEVLRQVALRAELGCATLKTADQAVSDLQLELAGRAGVFDLDPITLRAFEGKGTGTVRADFTGKAPRYTLRYDLAQFRLDAALKSLSPGHAPEGTADFSAELALQGTRARDLKRSLQGKASLRGRDIVLHGRDLDEVFDGVAASQSFNLVDVGAVLLAGPVGLAVTKGYDFASILQGAGGRSELRTLVSDWTVQRGVARAQDVAIATRRHRVAMQGRLDFVNARFDGVTVALVDARGCATVQQKIRGTFAQPVIDKPSTLSALTGPVVRLFRKVVPGDKCETFYAGSVAAPQ